MRGNNGFTLAEVLITLVIIGVIGALTVPSLIQNTQKQEYVSALKKAYSTLSQAAQMIIAEEGSPKGEGSWLTDADAFYNMYKKYLNNVKDCGSNTGCFGQQNAPNGIGTYKYLNGSGSSGDWDNDTNWRKMILSDGMQLMFNPGSLNICNTTSEEWGIKDVCAWINIDINGEKGPNTVGRDLFLLVLKENGLYPAGCDAEAVCNKNSSGYGCACKVLREGAMNY